MRTITVQWLIDRQACNHQVATVENEWGTGEIPLTRENLLRAAELKLDLVWLANTLDLSDSARRIYDEAIDSARRIYVEAIAEPRRIYDEAIAEAERIYDEATAELVYTVLLEEL